MVQLGAAYWYAKYFTQQLSILAPSCAFVMQLSKCNLCFKHHTYERGHIWSQCTIKSYAKLRQHVNIKLGGISGTYVAKLDRLGLSWIMKSTLQFWLNQWTQTLLTSADIGYMCHSVLYISIGQAQDMSFSVASLPSLSLFQSISTIIDSCFIERTGLVLLIDLFYLFRVWKFILDQKSLRSSWLISVDESVCCLAVLSLSFEWIWKDTVEDCLRLTVPDSIA